MSEGSQDGRRLGAWLLLSGLVTLVVAGLFVGIQQQIRSAANYPQKDVARAAVAQLNLGASPQSVVPAASVDLRTSTDSYVIVLGPAGELRATSAALDGSPPVPPSGVFDYVRSHGEDVISWQPTQGVRSAIVVDAYHDGFVVAGRSLRGAEDMESRLQVLAMAAWCVCIAVVTGLVVAWRPGSRQPH
jgi:hypothetical protein